MRVVITGGGGMLGQKLARALAGRGGIGDRAIDVLALADVKKPPAVTAPFKVTCHKVDITDRSALDALFADGADAIFHLAAIVSNQELQAGQVLFNESEPAEHVFNVTAGTVKVYKLLADGRCQITGFLFPGDFLGLANEENYAYTAEAVNTVMLCVGLDSGENTIILLSPIWPSASTLAPLRRASVRLI